MKHVMTSGLDTVLAHVAATALPMPPVTSADVSAWNGPERAVPELDVELWSAATSAITAAELLAGVPHAALIADVPFTTTHATETFNAAAHPLQTGDGPVRLTNAGGALPAGVLPLTDYWVYKTAAGTFKLATTRALAMAGTPDVVLTGDGVGVHTLSDVPGTTERVYWESRGLLDGDGAFGLSDTKGFVARYPHHPRAIAYAVTATVGGSVATTVAVHPVVEV